jgi:all-trans-retinol 13,14-reductase
MHASVVKHYFKGGSFPIGGSSEIVNTINPVIEKSKGKIVVKAEVKEIIIEKNRARGVVMDDGRKFYSNTIISGVGVFNTFNKLINEKLSIKLGFKRDLLSVKPSVAHGCLIYWIKWYGKRIKITQT